MAERRNSFERLFQPVSNVDRKPEDGCMKKIKLERSLKLRKEDIRDRNYNILSNNQRTETDWINSFGDQTNHYLTKFQEEFKSIHDEKHQISPP